MHFVAFWFAIFAWIVELFVLIWIVKHLMTPSTEGQLSSGGQTAVSNGDRYASAQLKKDWVVMLASTSGVMLTVCLATLSVIYTSSNTNIGPFQKLIGSIPIFLSASFLMICSVRSLRALGALIMFVDIPPGEEEEKAKKTREDSFKKFVGNSRSAESFFIFGSVILVISILTIIVVFNWTILETVQPR